MFNTKYKVGDKVLVEAVVAEIDGPDGLNNYKMIMPSLGAYYFWSSAKRLQDIDKTPKDQKKQLIQKQIEQMQAEIERKQKEMEML